MESVHNVLSIDTPYLPQVFNKTINICVKPHLDLETRLISYLLTA